MKGKTHRIIGTALGIFLSSNYPLNSRIVIISSAIVGALIPDIDHSRNSFNQKYLKIKNDFAKGISYLVISILLGYLGYKFENKIFITLCIITALTGFSNHRGFTHSIFALILYYKLAKDVSLLYNSKEVLIGFMGGYISHIALDICTNDGVRILYPMKGHISLPIKIKSKGKFESLISKTAGFYSVYNVLKYTGFIKLNITEIILSFITYK